MKFKIFMFIQLALLLFALGFVVGGSGHMRIIKDDGTICAEIK